MAGDEDKSNAPSHLTACESACWMGGMHIVRLACLLALFALTLAEAREFTSADGKQSMKAEFIRYHKSLDQVTLRLSNGHNMVTEAKHFSEADREFFKERARQAALRDAVKVGVDENSNRHTHNTGQMAIRKLKAQYEFTLKNVSDYALEDLNLHYWVVVQRDQQDKPEIHKGDASISKLDAGGETEIKGPKLDLTLGAASTCNCPRVEASARMIGRDRILGERVEVRTADGKLIYSDSSSMRVDKALESSSK